MQPLETFTNKDGNTVKIFPDTYPANPREEFDNLGKLLIITMRDSLDEGGLGLNPAAFSSWDEVWAAINRRYPRAIILPLYKYEHSGVAYNTVGFHCPWDSGQVGFIYVPLEKVREEYGVKRVSKALRAKVKTYLEGEVETFSQWASGSVYGFQTFNKEGEEVDSCWGFYGYDHKESGLFHHAGVEA